jgi:GT2 family glycosyltransferase
MDLSVVVVSYNSAGLLERCLAAVRAHPVGEMEIIVVDNASSDGSAALVRERFPEVMLIANDVNRGFGAANNQALRRATGELVALVNPDCEVRDAAIAQLVCFLRAHPRAAVAGGGLRYGDGAFQHSAFRFPSLAQIALDFFPLNWRLLESPLNGRYAQARRHTPFQIDHPLGAFMCLRRTAFEQAGGFDEAFFMYVEEVDLCYRIKRAGWEVWCVPDAVAVHLGGQSTRLNAPAMFVQLHRSRQLFYRRHYSRAFQVAARVLVWLGAGAAAAKEGWAALRDRDAAADHRRLAAAKLELLRL